MKQGKLIRNWIVALLMVASAASVFAADNPGDTGGPVSFKLVAADYPPLAAGAYSGSAPIPKDVPTGRGVWNPADNNWNARFTTAGVAQANKIANVQTNGVAFPRNIVVPLGGGGGIIILQNVTAAMVNKYWDEDYYKVGQAGMGKNGGTFTRITGAQFVQNCYGFATGKGYVVQPDGFDTIIAQEYKAAEPAGTLCVAGCVLKLPGDHCIKLTECCVKAYKGKDSIKKTQEINGTSGQYDGVWSCDTPVFGGQIAGTIYCK